jgi:DNA excision repair protein ERCC-2
MLIAAIKPQGMRNKREHGVSPLSKDLCQFFEDYEKEGPDAVLPPGVYTLADLRAFGRQKGWCPYFLARHMISYANVAGLCTSSHSSKGTWLQPLDLKRVSWFQNLRLHAWSTCGRYNAVVYNYQYLLDPKVSGLVSRELEKECVVVFDEVGAVQAESS